MTRILVERGILTDDKLIEIWDSASQGFRQRPFDTEEITGKELSELVSDFNIDLNFFHNYNIRTGNFGEMISKLDKIIGRYPYHTVALSCRARCLFETGDKEAAQRDVAEIRRLIGTNNDSKKMADKYEMQMAEILSVTTTKAFL
jgi:hypothetical protein